MADTGAKDYFYILKKVDCYRHNCNKSRILTPKGIYIENEKNNFIIDKKFDKNNRNLYKLGLKLPCECCKNIQNAINFYSYYDYKPININDNPSSIQQAGMKWFCGPFGFCGFLVVYKETNSKQEFLNEFIKFENCATKYNRIFFKKYLNLNYQNKIIEVAKIIYNKNYMFGGSARTRIENQKKFIDFIINTLRNNFNKNIFAVNENGEIINGAEPGNIKVEKHIFSDTYEKTNDNIKYPLINIINNKFKQHLLLEFPVETGVYNKYKRKIHDCFNVRIFSYDKDNNWMYEFSNTIKLKENEKNITLQSFYSEYDVIQLIQGLLWILTFHLIN